MKWKSWSNGFVGETRVKSWFAILPVRIGSDCRWLERVTVEYKLTMRKYDYYWCGRFTHSGHEFEWVQKRFVDG